MKNYTLISKALNCLLIHLLPALAAIPLVCCVHDPGLRNEKGVMPLVIEGWIEEGEYPIVIVTRALDLTDDDTRIEDAIEKWCRVTIYDDGIPHVLTARKNTAYNPNFIFTSNKFVGMAGHTYRLTVETEDTVAQAESTILPCASIQAMDAVMTQDSETSFTIRTFLTGIQKDLHYKIFCKGDGDSRHFPAFAANLSGAEYDRDAGVNVSRGPHSAFLDVGQSFSHYFSAGETVEVKICSMDQKVYDFWMAYDLNVSLSNNLFLNFVSDCPGNISGAKGYWAAYGSSLKIFRLPDSGATP